jgi:phosphatidylinositol alpha-1,6-mannosyltransferase
MLALVTDAFGGRGGIAQYNRDFLGVLAQDGTIVSIMVLPRHAPDAVSTPQSIFQTRPHPSRIAYIFHALWLAGRKRPDLVFCGHLYMAPLAWLAARLAGARLVMQMHGIEAWKRPSALRRAAVESADSVFCVSRYTRSKVLDWAAITPERAIVVPNTVDERFSPGSGETLRREWRLEGKRVLLTVGRLDSRERYKGQDRVIAALPELLAAGHDIVYVIAGEGDDRARLEALAQDSGVAERVKFVGAISRETLLSAYRMADLFVMPSTGEGFGIAFLEAMACGTPALGLDVAGAHDALGEGVLGSAVAEETLVAAIDRLLRGVRQDADILAAATRARFGRDQFQAKVNKALALHSGYASSKRAASV